MELKECINFLLTTSQHTVFQYLSQNLAPFDVTPSQYGVLNCLWANGGTCLPRKIAEMLCLETSTVSGILDRMQKKELIDRVINTENRREILVIITEKGEALKEPVLQVIEDVNRDVLADFSEDEAVFFKKCLRQIAEKSL